MSYFHVLVKKNGEEKWLCIYKDISKAELRKQFIKPYRLGRELFYDGNILATKILKSIKIIETKTPHSEELKVLQEESHKNIEKFNRSNCGAIILSIGYGYNESDIVSSGSDVTLKYIKWAPGSGTFASHFFESIKHPWVVRIFASIAFLAIAAFIGLR